MLRACCILMLAASQLLAGKGVAVCVRMDGSFCCLDNGPVACTCADGDDDHHHEHDGDRHKPATAWERHSHDAGPAASPVEPGRRHYTLALERAITERTRGAAELAQQLTAPTTDLSVPLLDWAAPLTRSAPALTLRDSRASALTGAMRAAIVRLC